MDIINLDPFPTTVFSSWKEKFDWSKIILCSTLFCGGIISKEIFAFPGGHRFHFIDPSGNELAVWSDK